MEDHRVRKTEQHSSKAFMTLSTAFAARSHLRRSRSGR